MNDLLSTLFGVAVFVMVAVIVVAFTASLFGFVFGIIMVTCDWVFGTALFSWEMALFLGIIFSLFFIKRS